MSLIDVTFIHPVDGTTVDVTLDDNMTADDIINELINAGFIQRTSDGYDLSVKGGGWVDGNQALRDGGAIDKCIVRIVPLTCAYGCPTAAEIDGIVPECMMATFDGFQQIRIVKRK